MCVLPSGQSSIYRRLHSHEALVYTELSSELSSPLRILS